MASVNLVCECGSIAVRDFDGQPEPGLLAGFQCRNCNRILLGQVPGHRKFLRDEAEVIQTAILEIFTRMEPRLTVRQIFYALTVLGVISKDESGYRTTCRHLAKMRRNGALPYGWIADNTRWQVKPTTYPGLAAALERWQEAYRRDLWAAQEAHVEIWVEKDALAGVISPITQKYDVPLYVARGYGSMTFIYDAAQSIKAIGKPTYIYHFGDFDPSGVDTANKIRSGLIEHGANIFFERAAITPVQIDLYDLPTRMTKKSDPRAKSWGDKPSVELDAMPAPVLRKLVRTCIEQHIDPWQLERTREIEAQERATLAAVAESSWRTGENEV